MRWTCFVVSETKRRCGFFLDVFGLTLPEYLECDLFPESEDSDVCVGHKEVVEADKRAQKPGTLKEIELLLFVVSKVWLFYHDFRKTMIFTQIYSLKVNFHKFLDGKVDTANWETKTSNNFNSCKFRDFQTIDIKVVRIQ